MCAKRRLNTTQFKMRSLFFVLQFYDKIYFLVIVALIRTVARKFSIERLWSSAGGLTL